MKPFLLLCLGILGCYADSVRDRFFKSGVCDARLEFRCSNDECIERKLYCDGNRDCKDGSDEAHCKKGFHENGRESGCPSNFFKCTLPNSYDKCIPQQWRCDGITDCNSGLDEKECRSIVQDFFKIDFCDASHEFRCSNDECIKRRLYCDGNRDCKDGSDEAHCNYGFHQSGNTESRCPATYFKCTIPGTYDKCIPQQWRCDGIIDCKSGSDEKDCGREIIKDSLDSLELPRLDAIKWLNGEKGTEKWSDQVHRIAVAFHLAGAKLSSELASELASEVKIQLLSKLAQTRIQAISSGEIALYIHALLVTCGNPRAFHSYNLVAELRKRINAGINTNPYIMLALCNARDEINEKDIEKVTNAFYSNHTEFWSDTQAHAIMALTCAARNKETPYNIIGLEKMILDLKNKQKENGIVDNLKTTSLVMQVLSAAERKEKKDQFDEKKAMKQLLLHQLEDGSFGNFIDTYYTLPVLNYRNFADINSNHCPEANEEEEKMIYRNWFHGFGTKYSVQYSQHIGDRNEFRRTLSVRIPTNTSFYTLMKMAASMDDKFKFKENIKDGKPFIYSLSDLQDDPEIGKGWVLCVYKSGVLVQLKNSPMDFTVENNQHFVFWYRTDPWL